MRLAADRTIRATSGFDGSVAGDFFLGWAPLDWLEVSFILPGIGVLLGTRHHDEVLLSAGVEGFAFGCVAFGCAAVVAVSAGVAYRHWFTRRTSLASIGRYTGALSTRSPDRSSLSAGFLVSHTVRDIVSFNFGVRFEGWPDEWTGVQLGSGRLGFRPFPVVQVHLSRSWTLNFDASVGICLHPRVATSQSYLSGFMYLW